MAGKNTPTPRETAHLNQKILYPFVWITQESTVEIDRKEYANEGDYGFPDEVFDISFPEKVSAIDMDLLESNCAAVEQFYAEMADSIHTFN